MINIEKIEADIGLEKIQLYFHNYCRK